MARGNMFEVSGIHPGGADCDGDLTRAGRRDVDVDEREVGQPGRSGHPALVAHALR